MTKIQAPGAPVAGFDQSQTRTLDAGNDPVQQRSPEAAGTPATRPVDSQQLDTVTRTHTRTKTQLEAAMRQLEARYSSAPGWPTIKRHMETLLAQGGPATSFRADELIGQLARMAFSEPESALVESRFSLSELLSLDFKGEEKKQLAAYQHTVNSVIRDLNNEVFANRSPVADVDFTDHEVTPAELSAVRSFESAHPEQFPFATTSFSRDAHLQVGRDALSGVSTPAELVAAEGSAPPLERYYLMALRAWAQRHGYDLSKADGPKGLASASEAWLTAKNGLDEEVALVEYRNRGWVGFQRVVEAARRQLGHDPTGNELLRHIKEHHSIGPFSLTTEGDAICAELAKYLGYEAAKQLLGDVSAEDGARFSLEKPSTWFAILLTAVNAVAMALSLLAPPVGLALLLCNAGSLALSAGELALDGRSGHLTDNSAAHARMLQEPTLDSRAMFRMFDPRSRGEVREPGQLVHEASGEQTQVLYAGDAWYAKSADIEELRRHRPTDEAQIPVRASQPLALQPGAVTVSVGLAGIDSGAGDYGAAAVRHVWSTPEGATFELDVQLQHGREPAVSSLVIHHAGGRVERLTGEQARERIGFAMSPTGAGSQLTYSFRAVTSGAMTNELEGGKLRGARDSDDLFATVRVMNEPQLDNTSTHEPLPGEKLDRVRARRITHYAALVAKVALTAAGALVGRPSGGDPTSTTGSGDGAPGTITPPPGATTPDPVVPVVPTTPVTPVTPTGPGLGGTDVNFS